jgi:hypothetical protein
MLDIKDFENEFMCCGKRLELMRYAGVWALGCLRCELYRKYHGGDEPIFIISDIIEIGGN